MKKFALVLALVMLVTSVLCIFPSAATVKEGEKAVFYTELFEITAGAKVSDIEYLGTETDFGGVMYPDDEFGLAVKLITTEGFCYYKYKIKWDYTKVQYVEGSADDGVDVMGVYDPATQATIGYAVLNSNDAAIGEITMNFVKPSNVTFTTGSGRTAVTSPVTDALLACLYFKPLTADGANANFTFTYTEVVNADKVTLPSSGETTNFTLNGGAAAIDPITSLGAKVNAEKSGLRFGAKYGKVTEKTATEVGMLLIKSVRLGAESTFGETLDLADAADTAKVAKVVATGIDAESFVAGKLFADYDSFVYYATIIGIPAEQLSTDITAVPYVIYSDGSVAYGDALVRNYTDVAAA